MPSQLASIASPRGKRRMDRVVVCPPTRMTCCPIPHPISSTSHFIHVLSGPVWPWRCSLVHPPRHLAAIGVVCQHVLLLVRAAAKAQQLPTYPSTSPGPPGAPSCSNWILDHANNKWSDLLPANDANTKGKKQPITSTRLEPACQGRMENQMHLTIASESSLRQTLKDPAPPLYLL